MEIKDIYQKMECSKKIKRRFIEQFYRNAGEILPTVIL